VAEENVEDAEHELVVELDIVEKVDHDLALFGTEDVEVLARAHVAFIDEEAVEKGRIVHVLLKGEPLLPCLLDAIIDELDAARLSDALEHRLRQHSARTCMKGSVSVAHRSGKRHCT